MVISPVRRLRALFPDLGRRGLLLCLLSDVLGAFMLGVSVTSFAVHAGFAPGGVTGLAVIAHHLAGVPIGLGTVLINLPIIALTWRRLGPGFFVMSLKTLLICAFFADCVTPLIPPAPVSRLPASLLSGVCAGIGYALIFDRHSSTGGTDFIIVALRQAHPRLSFGRIAFAVDSLVIVLSVFVFRDFLAFAYGMLYSFMASLSMDSVTALMHAFSRRPDA